jgi:hypothetical protein
MLTPLRDSLFNSPTLFDVKIKQVFNGKIREYYSHKAVLCMASDYFLNMFTGDFMVSRSLHRSNKCND